MVGEEAAARRKPGAARGELEPLSPSSREGALGPGAGL